MTLIDHTNFSTTLKQSTTARNATPNGNFYYDKANNRIQLIGVDELPTVDFGAGAVTNPLNNADGVTLRALYNFDNAQRKTDETLRQFLRGTKGVYRFAGAYGFVNGVKLDGTDRNKIRSSGWTEYAATGDGATNIDRVYHGVVSLVPIQAGTTTYWTLTTATTEAALQAATWTNFVRTGPINEAVQVFGSTAHGDTGAGSFDYTTRTLTARVRSWGNNPGETTSAATGIPEFSGFSAGYGVGESTNASNPYALADVYGGARIAPWTGMTLEKLAVPQTETGFAEADGDFTWVLHNTLGGTVQECTAYLDALQLQDADIDIGTGTYNGKKGRTWHTHNAAGKIVTASLSGEGLFIEGLSDAEKQNIIMTDDAGDAKTYPFFPSVVVDVGAAAVADTLAWYHLYYADGAASADFDTAGAVTVNDKDGNPVKGNVSTDAVGEELSFSYDYDGNTQAGLSAGVDKDMVLLVEGDGGAGQAIAYFTMKRQQIINITCAPAAENNA